MRRISMIGVCFAAILALTAVIASTAQAETLPTYGQCIKLTKYTTPKEKKGKYKDANCTQLEFKEKGKAKEHVASEKGLYEWVPGPPANCVKLSKAKGKYSDAACTTLHTKEIKKVPTPDGKGEYEKLPETNGPKFTSKGLTASKLTTPALGAPIICATKTATGTITSGTQIESVATFENCETGGKKCTDKSGAKPGDIITEPLIGNLYVPSAGFVGTDYQAKAGKSEMSSEISCEGTFARTHNDVGGHITSGLNVMSTSGIELLDETTASNQGLLTEASLSGFGGPWAPPGGAIGVEETKNETTYDSPVEVRSEAPKL